MKREWIRDLDNWVQMEMGDTLTFESDGGRTSRVSFRPENDILVYGYEDPNLPSERVLMARCASGDRTEIKVSHLETLSIEIATPQGDQPGDVWYRVHTGTHIQTPVQSDGSASFVMPYTRMTEGELRFRRMELEMKANADARLAQIETQLRNEYAARPEPSGTSQSEATAGGTPEATSSPTEPPAASADVAGEDPGKSD